MKVVSIDFDILMHQDLMIYNDAVKYKWFNLLNNPMMQTLRINTNLFSILTLWLLDQIKDMNPSQIFFIKDHQSVNHILEVFNIEKCELYNIDFHHDLGYSLNPSQDQLNCGNWVFKLLEEKKLLSYTWLNAKESSDFFHKIDFGKCHYDQISIIDNSFKLKELEKPDILIICLSPEWVPPYCQNLFYLWMDLLERHFENKFELL